MISPCLSLILSWRRLIPLRSYPENHLISQIPPSPPPRYKRITGFNIQPHSDLTHYLTVDYMNVDSCLQTKGEYARDPLESYSPSWSLFGLETQQAGDVYVWNRTLPYNNHRLVSPNLVLSLVFLLF